MFPGRGLAAVLRIGARRMCTARPANVGIVAMEAYTPSTFVRQSDLEAHDGVPSGKYAIGLGQESMAFCYPEEDVVSMSLNSTQRLLRGFGIEPAEVGFLAVGHESPVDKSKSVKTSLLSLFDHGDLEGADNINACYGGTAALLSAVAWVQSPDWDGRYAVVVAGDVACYPKGAARPTGGAASVAMLIGANAPIVLETGLRHTYCEDAYDFYKPDMESEYPRVDGHLSNDCYIRALDTCNTGFAAKFEAREGRPFDMDADADFAVFHQPYEKLVRKSFAWCASSEDNRHGGRDEEKARVAASRDAFEVKVAPSTRAGCLIGNSYCGSLYVGLLSLISSAGGGGALAGKRALMFSYGSGLISTMFALRFGEGAAAEAQLDNISTTVDLWARLDERKAVSADIYSKAMELREDPISGQPARAPHVPAAAASDFVLATVDEERRRSYTQRCNAPI